MPNMLSNVLSNIFTRPATRSYPAVKRPPFAHARGHMMFDTSTCGYCGACARRCPAAAIAVNRQEKTLTFEPFRCIICEACAEVCPRKSISTSNEYRAPAYAKSNEVYATAPAPAGEGSTPAPAA